MPTYSGRPYEYFEGRTLIPYITCDDCDAVPARRLVDGEDGPRMAITCDCRVHEPSKDHLIGFRYDLPDEWVDTSDEDPEEDDP